MDGLEGMETEVEKLSEVTDEVRRKIANFLVRSKDIILITRQRVSMAISDVSLPTTTYYYWENCKDDGVDSMHACMLAVAHI